MQVVYLDLRDHGGRTWGDPASWSFEACADDVRAFCDALGIERPIVLGHSMGGFVAILYGSRHPGHAGGLILLSTFARFDLDRLADGFRDIAGDEIGALARRAYDDEDVTDDEWARVFAAFGPHIPTDEELARRVKNTEVNERGGQPDDGAGSPRRTAEDPQPHAGLRRLSGPPGDNSRGRDP